MFFLMIVLFGAVGVALTILTMQNFSTLAHLTIFTWQTPNLPLGLLILIAFLTGAFLLYLVSAIWAWLDQREVKKLRKRIAELEKQVAANATVSGPVSGHGIPVFVTPTIPMPGMTKQR